MASHDGDEASGGGMTESAEQWYKEGALKGTGFPGML